MSLETCQSCGIKAEIIFEEECFECRRITWAKRDTAEKKYKDEHKIRIFLTKIIEITAWIFIGYLILLVLNVIYGNNTPFVLY